MVYEGRKEMLDQNDKKWVEDLLDRKLDETKSDLRGEMQEMKTELRDEMQEIKTELRDEMQEMKTELRDEMQEMKTELRNEMQEMKGDIISQVTAVFENTYEDYIKLISEIVPDKVRSYDRVEGGAISPARRNQSVQRHSSRSRKTNRQTRGRTGA